MFFNSLIEALHSLIGWSGAMHLSFPFLKSSALKNSSKCSNVSGPAVQSNFTA
jgi:hypothetical protein